MANGRVVVPAPAFTPSQYGLLSVAEDRTALFEATVGSHWAAGIIWQPLCPDGSTTYDECISVTGVGATPAPPTKDVTFDNVRQGATPFTVYFRKDCSIPTYWDEASGEVLAALTGSESFEVERAFWTGTAGGQQVVYPHLAEDTELVQDRDTLQFAVDVVEADPVGVVQALGLLEEALAECYGGGQGVIHADATTAALLVSELQIFPQGGRYRTARGNLVAIGGGYTGSAPDGSNVDDVSWMYATGPVFYARGPVMSPSPRESVGLSVNDLDQMAERTYVVGFSCCLLGIPVATVGSGGPSTDVTVTNLPATYPQPSTQRTTTITRLTGGADLNIAAGSRSYTVTVIGAASAASPTLDGVALPQGYTGSFSAPENDTLEAAAILTVAGDDVIVLEVR